jgi:hypothetical protein
MTNEEEDNLIRQFCANNPSFYDKNCHDTLVFDANFRRLSQFEIIEIIEGK